MHEGYPYVRAGLREGCRAQVGESMARVFFLSLLPLAFEQDLLLESVLTHELDSIASQRQSLPPPLGLYGYATMSGFLHGCWGKCMSSCLLERHPMCHFHSPGTIFFKLMLIF